MATTVAETVFLDTNILLAATDRSRKGHLSALRLASRGRTFGMPAAWSGQVIREYLAVATRPVPANGLGLGTEEALRNVQLLARRLMFCDETEGTSERLRGLIGIHELVGKSVHDANIVATMATHGIERLVTQNPEDFRCYPEVRTMDLEEVRLE